MSRLRTLLILLVGLALGCSQSESETRAEIAEPEEEEAAGPERPSAPAPSAPRSADPAVVEVDEEELPTLPPSPPLPAEPSAPDHYNVFVLPADDERQPPPLFYRGRAPEDDGLALFIPERHDLCSEEPVVLLSSGGDESFEVTIELPAFNHPDERVARLLNERLRDFALAQRTDSSSGVRCTGMGTEHLASITCVPWVLADRGMIDDVLRGGASLHLRIADSEVHEMSLRDAFVPGVDLNSIFRRACEAEVGEDWANACSEPVDLVAGAALSRAGVRVPWSNLEGAPPEVWHTTVSYDYLAEHLLANGPLARSLHRAGTTTRSVETSAPRTRAPAGAERWAVMPMASLSDVAMAWLVQPDTERATLSYVGSYLVSANEESARRVAEGLGQRPRQVRVPSGAGSATFRIAQTTRETPLLAHPDRGASQARTLPRGTIVVVAGGAADRYQRVVARVAVDGYVDARALGPAPACLPDLGPAVAGLPDAARPSARMRTMRSVTTGEGWARATYVTDLEGTSVVNLARLDAQCAVERSLARVTRPGLLEDVAIARTERQGGDGLIVTVSLSPRSVAAHTYDGSEIWTRTLEREERVRTNQREDGSWYPIVIEDAEGERRTRVAWVDGGLSVTR